MWHNSTFEKGLFKANNQEQCTLRPAQASNDKWSNIKQRLPTRLQWTKNPVEMPVLFTANGLRRTLPYGCAFRERRAGTRKGFRGLALREVRQALRGSGRWEAA